VILNGLRTTALAVVLLLSACSSNTSKPEAESAATTTTATAAPVPVPDDVRHAYDAALTSMQAGDWNGAASALKPIVDTHPELPGPAVNLGIAYVHLNRADEARKIVDSAAQASPGFAPAQHELGRILAAAGEFPAADVAYAHALTSDPNYALAYYDRAVLNELYLQRLPEALQDYEAYQRLQAKPDEQVARWITDLRRRTGAAAPATTPAATPGANPPAAAGAPTAASPPAQPPAKPAPSKPKGGSSS
jgi:tetratricopeptide (TPR) repeat protein